MSDRELIFVYNVDGTPAALLRDLYLSVTTGSTDCRLCDLTFGKVLKDPQSAAFVRALPLPVTFHLRSTAIRKYPELAGHRLPAAFHLRADGALREVLSSELIDAATTLDELRSIVEEAVDKTTSGKSRAAVSAAAR